MDKWDNEKIYKDLAIQEFYTFTTSANQELYSLPEDCQIEMITGVTISNNEKDQNNKYEWGGFSKLRPYMPNQKWVSLDIMTEEKD